MASALLASRNEACWGESKVYMRKNPNSNPNPRPDAVATLIHNSFGHDGGRTPLFRPMEVDEVPPTAAASAAVSDDASSFNRKPGNLNNRMDAGESGSGLVTFSISTYSKRELRELKRRLISELDQVRGVISRMEARESSISAGIEFYGGRDFNSVAPIQPLDPAKPRSADLPSKKAKTLMLAASPREPKRLAAALEVEKLLKAMMTKCSQILSKLMKHKKSVWFNSPVDVVGMGLHDYHQIVKTPMDLGTVKSRLNKGFYQLPEEFAGDIRLTFNNALLYNPQGHEVHKLADHLLTQFEGLFRPAFEKYQKQRRAAKLEEDQQHTISSRSHGPMPESAMRPEPASVPKVQPVAPAPSATQTQAPVQWPQPQPQPQPQTPVQLQQHCPVVARTSTGRLPKPKAKDLNKRPMSFEEKQKLGLELESLPHEKMLQAVQIIKKRKVEAMQKGDDEIELDIEVLDTETLWELDRFLCNFKKTLSKMRRQEAMANGLICDGHIESASAPSLAEDVDKSAVLEDTPEVAAAKKIKKFDATEEDVDIGDEMPATNYPSVEIEKDAGCASSSSSSDSDSSTSSDSDSDSSSESDSDEDEARSPG